MTRVLVITGGPDYAHDFIGTQGTGTALASVLSDAGYEVRCTDDIDAGFLASGDVDVVVINALRWRMLADQYQQWRDDWAFSPSAEARQAMVDFVHAGGGLVACHTAMICFDDWPQWGELLGGSWVWGTSSHPAPSPVNSRLVNPGHDVLRGVQSLDLVDEVYGDLATSDDITVLATARRHVGDADQPVVWTRSVGRGRVVVDAFGHDASSVFTPDHRQLLLNAVAWCTPARQEAAS